MCEHNTTIVKYDQGNVQVEVCTWGCGQTLIAVKDATGLTHTLTAAELSALRETNERLEGMCERLAQADASKHREIIALRERVEAYHEQIAEVNELLWEFTENPNIEMGEKGHEKIEDYFKKYSSNAERPAP